MPEPNEQDEFLRLSKYIEDAPPEDFNLSDSSEQIVDTRQLIYGFFAQHSPNPESDNASIVYDYAFDPSSLETSDGEDGGGIAIAEGTRRVMIHAAPAPEEPSPAKFRSLYVVCNDYYPPVEVNEDVTIYGIYTRCGIITPSNNLKYARGLISTYLMGNEEQRHREAHPTSILTDKKGSHLAANYIQYRPEHQMFTHVVLTGNYRQMTPGDIEAQKLIEQLYPLDVLNYFAEVLGQIASRVPVNVS